MNEKLKSENYQNVGGINQKFSPYTLGPMEFLDIRNLDFQMPGALTQRWGSTTYIGATSSVLGRVNGLFEYSQLSGFSQIIVGYTGGMWSYAGSGLNGISLSLVGTTFACGVVFQHLAWGAGAYAANVNDVAWGGDPSLTFVYNSGAQATLTIGAYSIADQDVDAETFRNFFFMSNGYLLGKYNGSTLSKAMLPFVISGNIPSGLVNANYKLPLNGNYSIACAFLSVTGDEGPILPIMDINTTGGTLNAVVDFNALVPAGFGITAINVYVNQGSTLSPGWGSTTSSNWNLPYYLYKSVGVPAGASLVDVAVGTTTDSSYFNAGTVRYFGDRLALGLTVTPGAPGKIDLVPFVPKYLEQYQNSLFFAGFSSIPSTVLFTDTGKVEEISPDSSFEVRTNDGDMITGMKNYGQRLMVGKFKSIHQLVGDNSDNFSLKEVSAEYGVYNNKCMITFGDLFAFLDVKGVILYNGAGLDILSYKVQPIIDRINQAAAVTHACMVHDKPRNQLLISVPVDGATLNNLTLAYDYVSHAWTTYDGYTPEVYLKAKGSLNSYSIFYGGWSGQVAYFGASLTQDYGGAGFTTHIKSRFIHEMGDSVQKQNRRLYLNIDAPAATLTIPINFYQDYGTSIVASSTLVMGGFQNRLEFGIAAKSIAFELYQLSTSSPFRLHGFTIEQRLQRKV